MIFLVWLDKLIDGTLYALPYVVAAVVVTAAVCFLLMR